MKRGPKSIEWKIWQQPNKPLKGFRNLLKWRCPADKGNTRNSSIRRSRVEFRSSSSSLWVTQTIGQPAPIRKITDRSLHFCTAAWLLSSAARSTKNSTDLSKPNSWKSCSTTILKEGRKFSPSPITRRADVLPKIHPDVELFFSVPIKQQIFSSNLMLKELVC